VSSVSGREATLVYAGPGALLGEGVFYEVAKGTLEAMVPAVVFDLPAHQLRAIREAGPQFKLLLLQDLEAVIGLLVEDVSAHAFGDLKTRLARHLLALAEVDRTSKRLDVRLTRAELASAVASTTDAVTRVVRSMAREGLLAIRRGRIQLLDAGRLLTIATTL
jgi:CRP-like cAMP-binding protein